MHVCWPLWGGENDVSEWPPWKENKRQNQKYRRNRYTFGKVFLRQEDEKNGILKVVINTSIYMHIDILINRYIRLC